MSQAAPLRIPPELKKITPFVRRSEELDLDKTNAESRLVAYYCRQYAVHLGIPLAQAPPSKQCLGVLLTLLEKEKVPMSNFTRDEAKFLCTQFADRVFEKANSQDEAGTANKDTAKTFYAAASFLEMLQQFHTEGEPDAEELQQRIKYCKWKATDILKALKEGRTPTPGGYNKEPTKEDDDNELPKPPTADLLPPTAPDIFIPPPVAPPSDPPPSFSPPPPVTTVEDDDDDDIMKQRTEDTEPPMEASTEVELGPPPSYSTTIMPPSSPPSVARPPLPQAPVAPPPRVEPPPPQPSQKRSNKVSNFFGMGSSSSKGKKASKQQIEDATEYTKFALAALNEKDGALALTRLEQAVAVLKR